MEKDDIAPTFENYISLDKQIVELGDHIATLKKILIGSKMKTKVCGRSKKSEEINIKVNN